MEKQYVRSLFDSIAYRYDLLNHVLSGGFDFLWRRRAIRHIETLWPKKVLDVATGTGDFAIAAASLKPEKIVGIDIAEAMLNIGRAKVKDRGLEDVITLNPGEAEHIQFESGTFDAVTVAFGARNFEDLEKGLSEMQRVLRSGGKVIVLEFSRPRVFPFKQLYLFYFRSILPFIGKAVSKHHEAYTYLPDTVMRFPDGQDFLDILAKAGFTSVREERLTLGIVSIYEGTKP